MTNFAGDGLVVVNDHILRAGGYQFTCDNCGKAAAIPSDFESIICESEDEE